MKVDGMGRGEEGGGDGIETKQDRDGDDTDDGGFSVT